MRKRWTAMLVTALLTATAGCRWGPCDEVCVDCESLNHFLHYGTRSCCSYPYSSPPCPYFDYPVCQWWEVEARPEPSAQATFTQPAQPAPPR